MGSKGVVKLSQTVQLPSCVALPKTWCDHGLYHWYLWWTNLVKSLVSLWLNYTCVWTPFKWIGWGVCECDWIDVPCGQWCALPPKVLVALHQLWSCFWSWAAICAVYHIDILVQQNCASWQTGSVCKAPGWSVLDVDMYHGMAMWTVQSIMPDLVCVFLQAAF